MNRLLIIADDFTGALDTGVQFSRKDIPTIVVSLETPLEDIAEDYSVVVLDSESRHLKAEEAFGIIKRVACRASEQGFTHLYKKTDSALRGNIGAELGALATATGRCLHFIPALPTSNRITRDGVQYIDGVPVAESIFGKDPFNPVTESRIEDIIRQESDIPVYSNTEHTKAPSIVIHDAVSLSDMVSIAEDLGDNGLKVTAGCAGFACVLADALNFRKVRKQHLLSGEFLLVICGSINNISKNQLRIAESKGYRIVSIPQDTLLKGEAFNIYASIDKSSLDKDCLVFKVSLDDNPGLSLSYKGEGEEIADALGKLANDIYSSDFNGTLFCIGGDTLHAIADNMKMKCFIPQEELFPGVVSARMIGSDGEINIITKSGGLGDEDIINLIYTMMRQ